MGRDSGIAQPDDMQTHTKLQLVGGEGGGSYVTENGKRAWPVQEREREGTKRELARPKCKDPQVWRSKLNR